VNLEVGQVWRRPDGTRFEIADLDGDDAIVEIRIDSIAGSGAIIRTASAARVPKLAVLEGWTLLYKLNPVTSMRINASDPRDVELVRENSHPLPDEGT
jgi:hypothetical protein